MAYDKIDELYGALVKDGAQIGTRQEFRSNMLAKGKEGYQNRLDFYNAMKADGADIGDTYEDFRDMIGLHAVKPAAKKPTAQKKATIADKAKAVDSAYPVKDTKGQKAAAPKSVSAPSVQNSFEQYNNLSEMPENASPFVQSLYEQDNKNKNPLQQPTDYTKPTAARELVDKTVRQNKRQAEATRKAIEREANRKYQPIVDTGIPEANMSVVKNQGQLEKEVEESGKAFVDDNLTAAISNAVAGEFSAAHERGINAMAGNTAVHGTGGSDWWIGERKYQQQIDPSKMLSNLQAKMNNYAKGLADDPDFKERVLSESSRLGVSPEDYVAYAIAPKLQEKLAASFDNEQIRRMLPKNTSEYIVGGVLNSMTGALLTGLTTTKQQRQLQQQADAMTENGENPYYEPGMWAKASRGTLGFVADAPAFGMAGKAAGMVTGKVLGNGVQQMARMANRSALGRIVQGAKQGALHGGVTGFLYGATNGVVQNYSTGEDTSIGNTLKMAFKGGLSEGASFATMSGIGGVVGAAGYRIGINGLEKTVGQTVIHGAQKLGYEGFKVAMEGIGMAAGGHVAALVEGEPQEWTLEGTLESCASAAMFRLLHAKDWARKGQNKSYAQTVKERLNYFFVSDAAKGAGYKFTQDEKDSLFGGADKAGMRTWEFDNVLELAKVAKKETSEDNGKIASYYEGMMNDPKIPWDAKAKFSALVMGVVPGSRPAADYRVFTTEYNGNIKRKYVNEYAADGTLLSKRSYKNNDKLSELLCKSDVAEENAKLWNVLSLAIDQKTNDVNNQMAFLMRNGYRPDLPPTFPSNALLLQDIKDTKSDLYKSYVKESRDYTLLDDAIIRAFGITEASKIYDIINKDPLERTEDEQKLMVQLRKSLTKTVFPEGKPHPEQSSQDGKELATENGLGTDQPNNQVVADELGNLKKAEDAWQQAMDSSDILKAGFEEMKNKGMTPVDIYREFLNPDGQYAGITEEQLRPLADYINANARVQGMVKGTQQEIEQRVGQFVTEWAYDGTMDGVASDGSTIVYVKDQNGNTLILGRGDVSFDENGRPKEGVGDMVICYDPNTKEMRYLSVNDITLAGKESTEDYGNRMRQDLQQKNSEGYVAAAQAQAQQNAGGEGNGTEGGDKPKGEGTQGGSEGGDKPKGGHVDGHTPKFDGEQVVFNVGDKVTSNGKEYTVAADENGKVIDENGKLHLTDADGNTTHLLPTFVEKVGGTEGGEGGNGTENSGNGNENVPTLTFKDGRTVPVDANGEPDFMNMSAEDGAEVYKMLFPDTYESEIDNAIKAAEKAVKDAEKWKPKATKLTERAKEQAAIKQAIDAAKAQLDKAKEIKKAVTQQKIAETLEQQGASGEPSGEVSEEVRTKFQNGPRLKGIDATYTMPDGTEIEGTYYVVESESLTPSHDANNNYKPNKGLPTNPDGSTLNDRDYEHNQSYRNNTDSAARGYDGRAVQDTPVVSDEGFIYSGNGRTMAGQKAAADGTDGAYVENLKKNAGRFGLTREQIEASGIKHPRVVFVPKERLPYDTKTMRRFNKDDKKSESNTENAVANSKALSPQDVASIVSEIEGTGSIDAFFNNPSAISRLVRTLQKRGIIGQNEVAQYLDSDGVLSAQGKEYVKNLLLGSLFKEETIRMMGIEPSLKSKAIQAMRAIIENRKLGEYTLSDEIDQAIRLLYEAKKSGSTVDDLLRSTDAFSGNAADRYPSVSQLMALALEGKVGDFRELLDRYNKIAKEYNTGEGSLFGEKPGKDEIVSEFLKLNEWKDYGTRHKESEGHDDVEGVHGDEQGPRGDNGEGPKGEGVEDKPKTPAASEGEGPSEPAKGEGKPNEPAGEKPKTPAHEGGSEPVKGEREQYLSEHPMTVEEIDATDASETRKAKAKDYISGEDTSELAKSSYRSVYNKVVAARQAREAANSTPEQPTSASTDQPKSGGSNAPRTEGNGNTPKGDKPSTTAAPVSSAVQKRIDELKRKTAEKLKAGRNKSDSDKSGMDAYRTELLNDDQNDAMLDLLEDYAGLGYELLKEGAIKSKDAWKEFFKENFGDIIKDATGFSDKDVEDLADDVWNGKHHDKESGKSKKLSEWAKDFGVNETLKDKENDTEVHNGAAAANGAGAREEGEGESGSNGTAPATGNSGDGGGRLASVEGTGGSGTKAKERVGGSNAGGGNSEANNGQQTGASDSGDVPKGRGANLGRAGNGNQPAVVSGGNGRGESVSGSGNIRDNGDRGTMADVSGTAGQDGNSEKGTVHTNVGRNPVDITQEKVPYESPSDPTNKYAIGSVLPSGVADTVKKTFDNLVKAVKTNVADFVRDELGYSTNDEMFSDFENGKPDGLSSEQVDSVALAINSMKNGKSFIIGDMTGVGKGRQAASLIRWGKKNGKKVIFVTEKAGLFSDMYRDLMDINTDLMPLTINTDTTANITDASGDIVYRHANNKQLDALFESGSDTLPKDKKGRQYDFVMMTYSQGGTGKSEKLEWIKNYAKDAIIVMDESHNAAGDSKQGQYFSELVDAASGVTFLSATYAKRPDNMMLYSLRSSLSEVNMPREALFEAIKQYGVPMQEILANGLFGSGEMIRRERDMDGVKITWTAPEELYDKESYAKARRTSDKAVGVINDIIDFQRTYVNPIVAKLEETLDKENAAAAMRKAPQHHYVNTPYSAQVSNVTNMLTYGLKAKKAAEMAIEQLKAGKKPVIALDNTMGAYVDELEDNAQSAGYDLIFKKGIGFSLKYQYARYEFKASEGKYVKVDKADENVTFDAGELPEENGGLSEDGRRALDALNQRLMDYIGDTDIEQLTISPIDMMKKMIEDAGYHCGEITGRNKILVKNEDGTYSTKSVNFSRERKNTANRFNGGTAENPYAKDKQFDALIINRSGATGISLHSSPKFGNTSPRTMIILQPAKDVNQEVQMRGRIDRTGQLYRGEYYYVTSPIPAEQKTIMMLKQKLASLDANAVGTEKVSSNKVDADDMDNKYGNEVAKEFLLDHLNDINPLFEKGQCLEYDNKTKEWTAPSDLLYGMLKGIQRLDCETQEYILSELSTRFKDKIDYLDQNGINDLKTSVMNLEASTIDKAIFIKGKNNESDSVFAHDTSIERVESNVLKKPIRSADMHKRMAKMGIKEDEFDKDKLDKDYPTTITSKVQRANEAAVTERIAKQKEAVAALVEKQKDVYPKHEGETEEEYAARMETMPAVQELKLKNAANLDQLIADLSKQANAVGRAALYLKPGMPYFVPLTDNLEKGSAMSYGRFLGFDTKDGKPRGVRAVFAVKDSRAVISIPCVNSAKVIDKIINDSRDAELQEVMKKKDDPYGGSYQWYDKAGQQQVDAWWDSKIPKNTNRQVRYMITGNILQACGSLGKYKGQIVTFTRKNPETGEITTEKGMLLAENFDPENFKVRTAVKKADVWDSYDGVEDKVSVITATRESNKLKVKFGKRKGQKLVDHPILKDEELAALAYEAGDGTKYSIGKSDIVMVFAEKNADKVLDLLYKNHSFTKERFFVMPDSSDKPDKIVRTGKPAQQVIEELGKKYGETQWQVIYNIERMLKRYKMDVGNEELKQQIREAVQLRQAYYRKTFAEATTGDIAWRVLIQDERIKDATTAIDRAKNDAELSDFKAMRDRLSAAREAMLEELEARGAKGTALHLKQGRTTVDEVKGIFDRFNKDKENAELMEKVYEKVKNLGLDVVFNEKIPNDTGGQAAGNVVEYNWKYMNADYILDQDKANTILHELIHTVTAYADVCMENGWEHLLDADMRDAITDLHGIYDQIKDDPFFVHGGKKQYGTANVREMLAEAGSNESFRKDLKEKKLWVKVMDGILRFFGIVRGGARQTTAYEAVRQRLEYLVENFNVDAWRKTYSGTIYGERDYKRAQNPMESLLENADEYREGKIVSKKNRDTLFRIEDELPVVEISDKAEWETLNHAIHTHNNFKKGEVNDEFTANNYYLYTHKGDGRFDVNFQIPIDGNEDLIGTLKKIVRNGTIRSAADIAGIVKDDWADRATDNYINADAQGRRDGDEGSVLRYRETGQNQGGRVANMASELSQGTSSSVKEVGSAELFKSLKNRTKNEYNETINVLSKRVADGRANLYGLSAEEAEGRPSVVQAGIGIISRDKGGVRGSESVRPYDDAKRHEIESAVEDWAKDNGYWKDEEAIKQASFGGDVYSKGSEARVYLSEDGKTITKVVDPYIRRRSELEDFAENVSVFNTLFPESAYTITGVTRDAQGKFRIIMEQPRIVGEQVDKDAYIHDGYLEKVKKYFEDRGFTAQDDEVSFSNGKFYVSDIHYGNVIFTKDGSPRIIDADAKYHGRYEREYLNKQPLLVDNDNTLHRESSDTPAVSHSRKAVSDHITKVAKRLGAEVRQVNSIEEVTNPEARKALEAGKKVTGWFDEATGKVELYLPNITDRYTAEKTVWHETVGHKGLEGLLGGSFRGFLHSLWKDKSNTALQQYVKENLPKNGYDPYRTIKEYLAEQAEVGHGDVGLWNRVRNALSNALHEIGYRLAPNTKDVRYLMWLAKNYQKNQNDPVWKARAARARWRIMHDKNPAIVERNGQYVDNDGKPKTLDDMTREEFDEATSTQVLFKTTPSQAFSIDEYNRILGTKAYAFKESTVDSMQSLKVYMEGLTGKRVHEIAGYMNPYLAQNRAESMIQQKGEAFKRDYADKLSKAFSEAVSTFRGENLTEQMRNAQIYMIQKSGLERNRVFYVRDAAKKLEPADAENLMNGWNAERQARGAELRSGQITLAEYYDKLDEYIKNNVNAKYEAGKNDYSGFHGMYNIIDKKDPYDDAAVIQEVMDAEASMGKSVTDNLWKTTKAVTNYTLQNEYDNGFIDTKTFGHLKGMMDWYVPMRKYDETVAEDVYGYITEKGDPHSGLGAVLMNAKGRKSLSDTNVLAQATAMADSSIRRGMQNNIRQNLMRFIIAEDSKKPLNERMFVETKAWLEKVGTDVNGKPIWEERLPVIYGNTPQEVSRSVEAFEQQMQALKAQGNAKVQVGRGDVGYKFMKQADKSQHLVEVMVNGQKKVFICQGNPRVAQAVNGMLKNEGGKVWVAKKAQEWTRIASQLSTSWNPDFVLSNARRDFHFASANIASKENMAYIKNFEANYHRFMFGFANVKQLAKGNGVGYASYFRKFRNGTLGNSRDEKLFKEFMMNGGETGFAQLTNMEQWAKDMQNDLKVDRSRVKKWSRKTKSGTVDLVAAANEIVENAARFAAYCASRNAGRDIARSIYDAKEVSTNFNRQGSGSEITSLKTGEDGRGDVVFRGALGGLNQWMRNYTMFYNAGIQGAGLFAKNLKHYPVRATAAMCAGPFVLGAAVVPLINGFLLSLEDEDERDGVKDPYAELPEYKRRNNVCIYIGGGEFYTIPLPIEMRAFYGIGDLANGAVGAATDGMVGNAKLQGSGNIGMDIVGQLAQIVPATDLLGHHAPGDTPGDVLKDVVGTVVPQITKPVYDVAVNRDWTGRPIYKDQDYMKNNPAWKRSYANTNEWLMGFNKKVNEWTNGLDSENEDLRGSALLDEATHPGRNQAIIEGYGGGMLTAGRRMGETTQTIGGAIKNAVTGEENLMDGLKRLDFNQVPLVRTFMYEPKEGSEMQRTKTKWYNYIDEMETAKYNMSQLKKKGVTPEQRIRNMATLHKMEQTSTGKALMIINRADKLMKHWKKVEGLVTDETAIKNAKQQQDLIMQEAVEQLDNLE